MTTYGPGRAELSVTLHALAAELASGVGDAVDLGDGSAYVGGCGARSLAYLDLDVTAASGTAPSLTITLETSRDGELWHAAPEGAFDASGSPGWQRRAFMDLDRYVRARWTLSAGASFTFRLSGTALIVYAGLSQSSSLALRSAALVELTSEEKADALVAASDQADAKLGARYQLPLVRWSSAITKHTASIFALNAMSARGYAPEPGQRDVWKDGYDRAMDFFDDVFSRGDPGIADQAPEDDFNTGLADPAPRGWDRGWTTR